MAKSELLSISQIYSRALANMQRTGTALFCGMIFFSILFTGSQVLWNAQFQTEVEFTLADLIGSEEKAKDLAVRVRQGDDSTIGEIFTLVSGVNQDFAALGDAEKIQFIEKKIFSSAIRLLPYAILLLGLSVLITFLATFYYYILSLQKDTLSLQQSFLLFIKKLIPFCFLGFWMTLRSFSWIPLAGPIFAIMYLPRFLLAPILMLKEKMGIMQSVTASMSRSKGYYKKLLGNGLVFLIGVMVLLCGVGLIAGSATKVTYMLGVVIGSLGYQFVIAYFVYCLSQLAVTVIAQTK